MILGAVSTWRDQESERWVYVPVGGPVSNQLPKFPLTNGPNPHGSIMAFRVVLDPATSRPALHPAWISGDSNLPDPSVIANGVLFALSTGENADQETDRLKN